MNKEVREILFGRDPKDVMESSGWVVGKVYLVKSVTVEDTGIKGQWDTTIELQVVKLEHQ